MSFDLFQGDCLDVMREMPDGSVDLIVTDPPYGMNYVSSSRLKSSPNLAVVSPILNDRKFDPEFHAAWMKECFRILKTGGAFYSFASDHHLGKFQSLCAGSGFRLKRTLVWVKREWTAGDLYGDYGHMTEFVVFGHKGRHFLNGKRTGNVLPFARGHTHKLVHSCQKPVPLLEHLIAKSSNVGDVVFDPFSGSGSTGVAAIQSGRHFIGIELDAGYLETSRERIAQAEGNLSSG